MHLFWLVDISSILIIRYFECYSFTRKRKYHTKHRGAASEMAPWIKILPVKSENLSSQPGDSHGGTRKQFMHVGLKRKWVKSTASHFIFFPVLPKASLSHKPLYLGQHKALREGNSTTKAPVVWETQARRNGEIHTDWLTEMSTFLIPDRTSRQKISKYTEDTIEHYQPIRPQWYL